MCSRVGRRKAGAKSTPHVVIWAESMGILWSLFIGIRYVVAEPHWRPRDTTYRFGRFAPWVGPNERVELLKKLWLEGLSASQIAKQLGGVTRNAVIGKVHRLGLSGRATPSQPSRTTFKTPRPPRPMVSHQSSPRRAIERHAPIGPGAQAARLRREPGTATVLTLGRPHVQMADRRSFHGRFHLLWSALFGRGPLLRRPRPPRLSAAPGQAAHQRLRTWPGPCAGISRPPPPLAKFPAPRWGGVRGGGESSSHQERSVRRRRALSQTPAASPPSPTLPPSREGALSVGGKGVSP